MKEETAECGNLFRAGGRPRVAEELGRSSVFRSQPVQEKGIDPETAMAGANRKFERRFNEMERLLAKDGLLL
ncbi:MAG: hypothetical protein ACLSUW_08195 [Akkermansia sp.]